MKGWLLPEPDGGSPLVGGKANSDFLELLHSSCRVSINIKVVYISKGLRGSAVPAGRLVFRDGSEWVPFQA